MDPIYFALDHAETAADRELYEFLVTFREARETSKRPPIFAYSCLEDWLLKHGTFFTPKNLPSTVRPMGLQQCYENAWRVAQRTKAYHYVEGFAIGMIPVLHAWLIDRDGNVIDPTWASRTAGIGSAYMGVELNLEEVRRSRRAGCYCLTMDYKRDYPVQQGVDVFAKDAWFRR